MTPVAETALGRSAAPDAARANVDLAAYPVRSQAIVFRRAAFRA